MSNIAEWQVILVDDEPDSLNLIAEMLALRGAEVYRAAGGAEALALLKGVALTVIVVDLSMPRPDGWDVLAAIRANPQLAGVPVVAITAFYSDRVEDEAHRAGFDGFCPKPIKSDEFMRLLQNLIG